ncbi:unnamed protein product [Camellia sinensis]
MEDDEKGALVMSLIDIVNDISAKSDYRYVVKRQYCNLARRLKMLIPMFEEILDNKEPVPEESFEAVRSLKEALESTREFLRFGNEGSKIYLVLERDQIMNKFQEVTACLEQALGGISYENLICQTKSRNRLSFDGDPGESIEKMSMSLKKIKDFVQTENPDLGSPARERSIPSSCGDQVSTDGNHKPPIMPDDFRCPISLELMKDPVIVSTGQTYECSCIEKWLEAGHDTCPQTQQRLTTTALTPNYVLRSLIAQWCEANGIEPPKRPHSQPNKTSSACSPAERTMIKTLLSKLTFSNPEDQRSAAGEIRLLAKRNADNHAAIAEAGAIPLLVGLLSTPDSRTQEHAVTALLNLSIYEDNKGSIISSGAVPGMVHVLKKGSMETRENAAATRFSLSAVDENKVTIGAWGAIPPLVTLLNECTKGKKDAATALFNLCVYQGNKGKAVRAGVVPTLMQLITETQSGMVDEALAILAMLSSHNEGKVAIGAAEAIPVLVEVSGNGSPRNKENAAAVLAHLCSGDQQYLIEAQELGVMGLPVDLAQNGTDRGKRKAAQLLAQAQARAQNQQSLPSSENGGDSREPVCLSFVGFASIGLGREGGRSQAPQ